jgi:site-specific recombinase XerD
MRKPAPRGVFERIPGSNVWWIHYHADGKRHPEKVGRKSDAIALYQQRKAEARAGVKLARPRDSRGVRLSELIDDALKFVSDHKDKRNYTGKAKIVRKDLGDRIASSLTPQETDDWRKTRTKTAATANRYKAFLSLCYQEGIANGKASTNPVRSVRRRREPKGRQRFLSRAEYDRLHGIIARHFPEHLAEFVVSVYTGMRLPEQYTTEWRQFHRDRKTIELTDTKSGDSRTVHLNETAFAAIESVRPDKPKPGDLIFTSATEDFTQRAWLEPCLAEAEIEDYTWHNNRHTFGSWLVMAGASVKEIQEAGGWKSIQMAARYSHLSPAHTASVVDRLA